jgi:hypothetical protein
MKLSTTREATSCIATGYISSILWNPKVPCRIHKSSSLIPIPSWTNPVDTTLSCLSTIELNVIQPTSSLSSYWSFPPIAYTYSASARSCHVPCPSHCPWLDHTNYTWPRVQIKKLLVMKFSPHSHHFIPLQSKYLPEHPVLKHPQSMFLP